MEDFVAGLCVGCLVALLSGILSYEAAINTMQKQAIAAQVACWQVDNAGQKSFSWNCK